MPLSIGDKLGHYEVLSLLGQGGMGEVYRARDTTLKRDVALKVLPEAFARDPGRMARFQREAEVLASLNHPNIAHIHGIEERALVMELVEGESPKGPLPFEDAWKIVMQIADALEYAHEKGVIHRDLKPANLKVTPEGIVKLLDFGLAKALSDTPDSASGDPANSPTVTLGATVAGTIMGTAAYMAPEQAKGKRVDKRADIWSCGVVLYEMLTGELLFKAEDAGDTLALVLTKQPDYEQVPLVARSLLRACLEKDPRQRLRDIGDAKRLVEHEATTPAVPAPAAKHNWAISAAVALAATVLAAAVTLWAPWGTVPDPPKPVRFQITPNEKVTPAAHAISPDGTKLVFVAEGSDGVPRVWIRTLDSLESRAVPGTESVRVAPLFWSADSRFVAFYVTGKLKRADIAGGPAQTLCDLPATERGGSWNRDGVVLYGMALGAVAGIQRVSSSGGTPSPVTELNPSRKDRTHGFPVFLPDGRHFLYFVQSILPENTGIYLGSLDSKPATQDPRRLVATTAGAAFSTSPDGKTGAMLFEREGTLMAQRFDLRALRATGEASPVIDGVGSFNGFGLFSASENGVLAYRAQSSSGRDTQLTWLDRRGKTLGVVGSPRGYLRLTISPDGTRLANVREVATNRDIWLTALSGNGDDRFTFDPALEDFPVWSPDGSRVAFSSNRGGSTDLYQHTSNGAGEDELLLKSDHVKFPTDWSRDGRFLLYYDIDPNAKRDLWVLPMVGQGPRKPVLFLQTPFNEDNGIFSPDGHWIAYHSDESGRDEVYVRPFPASAGGGGKWMVSQAGGRTPLWRGDGKELFYRTEEGDVMATPVSARGTAFQPGTPTALFRIPTGSAGLAVSADGQKFLVTMPEFESRQIPITIVLNWMSLLKKQ